MNEPEHPYKNAAIEVREPLGLRAFFTSARDALLDLVFPPRCAGCGRVDTVLCADCAADLSAFSPLLLPPPSPLYACAATGAYGGLLRRAIHALKYENDISCARRLALPLAGRLISCLQILEWSFDMVIPVPLHTHRLHERGYNQSELLGAHVAKTVHIPFSPTALIRQRDTDSQVGRHRADRLAAMRNAFSADPEVIEGHSLLLIDDVFTTGATVQACAEAAFAAGAQTLYSLTLAAAMPTPTAATRS